MTAAPPLSPPGARDASARSARWATALLALGAIAGAGLAATQLVGRRAAIPDDAVAVVAGVPIARSEYERALASVRADHRGGALTPEDEARVLDRLVDEELLVQRGLSLGLVRRDPRLRGELVSTLIAELVDGAEEREPTEAELSGFLAANRGLFPAEPLVRVEQIFFSVAVGAPVGDVERRARGVAGRLAAGEPWDALRALGDEPAVPLPSRLLPERTLVDALGPTAARTALELAPSATSDLIRSGSGYLLLRVVERAQGGAPELPSVRDAVRAEYLRRAGEERLRAALVALRADTDVRVRGRP